MATVDDIPKKILIGEDNPLTREILRAWILDAGLVPLEATSGQGVLAALEQRPDWLILDLHLADVDGLSLVADIRKRLPNLPIVAVSASTPEGIHQKCEALGIRRFFQKPLARQEMMKLLSPLRQEGSKQDLAELRRKILVNVDGNGVLFDRVVELFLEQSPGFMEQIERACRNENPMELERWAHKLRGYAGYISVEARLYKEVSQLESAGRTGDMAMVKTLLPRVLQAHRHLTRELRDLGRHS